MRFQLDQVLVDLVSDNKHINTEWERLFEGWLISSQASSPLASISLSLQANKQLPPLPPAAPYFSDAQLSTDSGILSVYHQPQNRVLLHFLDGALVDIPLDPQQNKPTTEAHGWVTAQALQYGRFEDVTFTSLAPMLRRQGYFLVHAFAAARNGRCVLIVGTTHSGKTTTGLNLLLNGWELLANDVILLRQQGEEIFAYPTPGDVGIRPRTFDLLPQLTDWLPFQHPLDQPLNITGQSMVNGRWAEPSRVEAIFLPQITTGQDSQICDLSRAISLTYLMQESIDRWDAPCLQTHINFLQHLCNQANIYSIQLGQDMAQIPLLIGKYSE